MTVSASRNPDVRDHAASPTPSPSCAPRSAAAAPGRSSGGSRSSTRSSGWSPSASGARRGAGRGPRPPAVDAWLADLAPVTAEAKYAVKNLRSWMRPTRVRLPMSVQPGKAWYQYEPLGVVLIIGPWNYPIHLVLAPLVGAVAAGNCAVLKPSEHTPACSAVLARLVPAVPRPRGRRRRRGRGRGDADAARPGARPLLLHRRPRDRQGVMAGAAKHLTPVTLELGGKSPVIVADDAKLKVAARRIAFAKLLNSGQTCVAPDYVLVDRRVRDQFVDELNAAIDEFSTDADPADRQRAAGRPDRRADRERRRAHRARRQGRRRRQARRAHRHRRPRRRLRADARGDLRARCCRSSASTRWTTRSRTSSRDRSRWRSTCSARAAANEQRVLDEISNGGTVINQPDVPPAGQRAALRRRRQQRHRRLPRQVGLRDVQPPQGRAAQADLARPALAYPPFTKIKQLIMRKVF